MNEQYKDAAGNYLVGQLLADAMTHDVKKWSAAYVADHSWRADLCDADLCDADLCAANLRGADLCAANLCDADLCGADLRGADLRAANLCDAGLRGADLRGADLRGANLCDAGLRGANLRGADLRGANLCDAGLSWNSHDLIAEILRRAADDDIGRRKLAGLVLVSRDWCWAEYATRLTDDEQRWCIEALRDWLVADWENAPAVLRRRARQLGVCDGAAEETEAA